MPLEQVNLPLIMNYQNCGQLNCGHTVDMQQSELWTCSASNNTLEIEVKSLNTHKILI